MMLIRTVTTVSALNSAGQVVESLPVRDAGIEETDIIGRRVDVVPVQESPTGVPVRIVDAKRVQNSVGQWVDTIPVSGLPWTPAKLGAKLLAWWDSSQGVTLNGSQVSAWVDRKSGYSASQGLSSARPLWTATSFNGSPGITFDGTDDCLAIVASPLPAGVSPTEMWAVVQQDAPGSAGGVRQIASAGDGTISRRSLGRTVSSTVNRSYLETANGTVGSSIVGSADLSTRHVVRGVYGATAQELFLDGVSQGTLAVTQNTLDTRFRIGANAAGTAAQLWQGQIRDLIVTSPLTAAEASSLQTFLMTRRAL